MVAGDERRLAGYAALPFNLNPYLRTFGDPVLAAGVVLPVAGTYDIVFDTLSAARAGKFTFRFWVNDADAPVGDPALGARFNPAARSSSLPPIAAPASTPRHSSSRWTAVSARRASPAARC